MKSNWQAVVRKSDCRCRKTIPASAVNQSAGLPAGAYVRCMIVRKVGLFVTRPTKNITARSNETRHSQIGVKDVFWTWNLGCLSAEKRADAVWGDREWW